jgi:hypothetical protein
VAHEPFSSRLAPARRRARTTKIASAGAAVAGFGIVALLARDAQPGSVEPATPAPGLTMSARIGEEARQGESFFQSGAVEPSRPSSAPQATTHTS